MVTQAAMTGAFIGACFGGVLDSRVAYVKFIENNQATIYKSTYQAKERSEAYGSVGYVVGIVTSTWFPDENDSFVSVYIRRSLPYCSRAGKILFGAIALKRQLQDQVTLAFLKGGARWGCKVGFFCGLFSLISTTISVYRDKTSVLEYTIAGAASGAIYKANLGLRGSLVGAGVGAVFASVAGLAVVGLLAIAGVDMQEIRNAMHQLTLVREYNYNKAKEMSSDELRDEITDYHDLLVKQKGEQKIEDL